MKFNSDEMLPFYREREANGIFSQWYRADMTIDGRKFFCCEQYMMWSKAILFDDGETAEKIMLAKTPKEIKKLGREVSNFDQAVWDKNKLEIVIKANYNKFTQNGELLKRLLATGDRVLVEASPWDRIWGVGLGADDPDVYDRDKWKGQNLLGQALMAVRDMVR